MLELILFMSEIGLIFFFFLIIILIYSFILLKDPASPQIMFLVKFGVYFSSIYFLDYRPDVYLIFVLILLVIFLMSSFYLFNLNKFIINTNHTEIKKKLILPTKIFWLMSLPSFLATYYLVNKFGGFSQLFDQDGLLEVTKLRTSFFASGLGALKTLISTFYVVHIYYFSYLINLNYKKYKITYILYGFHFLIFLFLATISFSRGTLLGMFVLMGLMWHYERKRISSFMIVAGLSSLMFIALVLGVVRETVTFSNGDFSLNYELKQDGLKKTPMTYGTFPLQTMLDAEKIDKQYGLTYLSGITIFIPRSIWPNKLDTGGVIFTKDYTNLYNEFSDFTTGMFPEAMINFGVIFGIIFASLQLILLIYWLNSLYVKIIYKNKNNVIYHKDIFELLFYIHTLAAVTGLLIGEFTNIFKGWVVQLVVLYITYTFIKVSNKIKYK